MTTTAHTPGPWHYHLNHAETLFVVRDATTRCVCDMSWHYNDRTSFPLRNESEANARLIAAAPELLVALRELFDRDLTYVDNKTAITFQQVQEARAAIRKATGDTE